MSKIQKASTVWRAGAGHPWCMIPMHPSNNIFFGAPVIDATLPTWSYAEKCTCAHPFSAWHTFVSQLSSLLTMIYNKGGANHDRMQRRIQSDSVFRCRYSFVEKANLVAIVRTRMTEDRVSFSRAVDSVGVPLSTLYNWQRDLPLTPSTLQQDHQGPPSFMILSPNSSRSFMSGGTGECLSVVFQSFRRLLS
jgi:hypothetical protein